MSGWVGADVQFVSDFDGGTDWYTANDTRTDTETSVNGTLQGTTNSLNATRLGSIGNAQIALATAEGNAAVARAQGYGQADVSWATAVGKADTALANGTASAHVTAVTSSSSATTQYEEAFSTAMTMSNEISGTAAVDYQALLGAAFVIPRNSRAIADATYQSSVADAQAVSSSALSNASLPFQERAATAYAAWIDAMGSPYILYATAVAQAEANYENATTVAATQNVNASATTPDDSVALAQAVAAYTSQTANLQAAQLLALANTESTHTLAQAQASSGLAVAQAQYQKTYETGLSDRRGEQPNDFRSAGQHARPTRRIPLRWPRPTRPGATACLPPSADLAVGEAAAQATLATSSASIDEQNAQTVAQQYASDEERWLIRRSPHGTPQPRRQRLEHGLHARPNGVRLGGLLGPDDGHCGSRLGDAQRRGGERLGTVPCGPLFAQETRGGSLFTDHPDEHVPCQPLGQRLSVPSRCQLPFGQHVRSQADAAYIVSHPTADNQIAADARANRALAVATTNATYQAAGHGLRLGTIRGFAGRRRLSYNPSSDDAAAGATYTLAIAKANATNAIALAQDQDNATTAAAQGTAAWTQAQDDATLAVTVTESQSYAGQQINLASLATSTYTQMGDSYAGAMDTFATAKPTPWAKQEAANADAAATYNDHALVAWLANQKSTLAANSQAEISAAKADAVFADQSAGSARATAIAGAAQQLATIRATQLRTLAQTQANPAGGCPAAPSAPNLDTSNPNSPKPGIDPAYAIARSAAGDFNLSAAAATTPTRNSSGPSTPIRGADGGVALPRFTSKPASAKRRSTTGSITIGWTHASDVSGYFTSIDTNPGSPNYGGWLNLTIDGNWHGGWNDGAVSGIFLHGISTLDPASTNFTTYINAHAPQTPNPAVQTISMVVGIGVGVACSLTGFGTIFAGSAGMAAGNATALLNGLLSGQSAETIAYNVFVSAGIGAIAGAAGGAASKLIAPIAEGLVGTLGLTCENRLGFVGAFAIGGADGAAFGAASSFVQVGLETGDINKAIDAAGQGAMWGGLIGGTLSMGLNAISPFVCFAAGMQVDVEDEQRIVHTEASRTLKKAT